MTEPETNPIANKCPQCGASLPSGALEGLCPACLLKQATADTATEARNKPFEPPGVAELTRLFPQLEILSLLGKGGMGAVYKARQPDLDRFVALKILPSETGAGSAERFNREARALARLSHPNIVAVYDFGRVEGLNYFIMEYVDGVNIRQLEQGVRISPREALQIIPQICDALQYAHDEGVVHRDIKPENVLVDRKGRVKVADFGLAKILNRADMRLTGEGQVMGTPHYMAPEQVERPLEVDHRADIFSLGVVLYEMLTGELPLGKFPPPSRMVRVDVRLDEVVLRSLEKKPEQRYQHASEVKSDVQTIANAPATDPKTVVMKPSPSCEAARKQVGAPATALMGLGVLGLALPFVLPVRGLGNGSIVFSIFGFGNYYLHAPRLASVAFWLSSFMPLAHLTMLVAGLRMRRLQSLVLCRIGACLALLAFPFQPIGVPFGIWALTVLNRRQVRREFGEMDSGELPNGLPHFSRMAIAGAVLALLPMLAMSLRMFVGRLSNIANPFAGVTFLFSLMASIQTWCPLGAVVLGWIALEDIRKGSRRGAGLAWFDVLFFACDWVSRHSTNRMEWSEESAAERVGYALTADLLTLAFCAGVAYWINTREQKRLRSGERIAQRWSSVGVWLARGLACGALGVTLMAVGRQIVLEMAKVPSQINLDAFIAHTHENSSGAAENSRFVIPLDGGQARLEAVSDLSESTPECWRPDGVPLCSPVAKSQKGLSPVTKPRDLVLTLDLPISTKTDVTSAAITHKKNIEPGLLDGMPYLPFELWVAGKPVEMSSSASRGEREFVAFHAPANASTLDFRVGEPVGDWQEAFISWEWNGKIPSHPERSFQCSGQKAQVSLGQVWQTIGKGSCEATWFSRLFPAQWVGRLLAVDDKGVVHAPAGNMFNRTILEDTSGTEGMRANTVTFEGLELSRIREFRFQVRPCQWVVMNNISLRNGVRTDTEIGELPVGTDGVPVLESWSPPVADGAKPEPSMILNAAQQLTAAGEYEEALKRFIWYFDHALEYDSGQTGVRLSFALSYWSDLAAKYPKAKRALIRFRDRDLQLFEEGNGDFQKFMELDALNKYLNNQDNTVALFMELRTNNAALASQCFPLIEETLVQKGQYGLCREVIGDPEAAFDRLRLSYERNKQMETQNAQRQKEQNARLEATYANFPTNQFGGPRPRLPAPPRFADGFFVRGVSHLVEILIGTGNKPAAEKIRAEALKVLDDPKLRSSVEDAERRVDDLKMAAQRSP